MGGTRQDFELAADIAVDCLPILAEILGGEIGRHLVALHPGDEVLRRQGW
jgi:hypothetical protein